jgi:hypothetical protein
VSSCDEDALGCGGTQEGLLIQMLGQEPGGLLGEGTQRLRSGNGEGIEQMKGG